jgi:uncharacterized membrane protein
MLSFLFGFLANNIIYPLIIPGIMAGSISILFSFFVPRQLAPYKMAFLIGGIVCVLFFTFYAGKKSEASVWEVKVLEQAVEIEQWKTASAQVTTETVTKYVDKVKTIEKVKTEYVTVYVDRVITPEIIRDYPLPNAFVRLHNAAASGELPDAP